MPTKYHATKSASEAWYDTNVNRAEDGSEPSWPADWPRNAADSEGFGYVMSDINELVWIANFLNDHFRLSRDVFLIANDSFNGIKCWDLSH
jgi:hypothetical protein